MALRHWFCPLLFAVHLLLVVCGACHSLPDGSGCLLSHMLRWYAHLSGADSDYGFYAPDVGDEHRARFILQDDQGFTWCDRFEARTNPEAQLRLGGSAEVFANGAAQERPASRQRLVKSWARAMFTRHPQATSVTVVVEAHEIPTMGEYRAGSRPKWRIVYQAEVQRSSPAPQDRIRP